ncbi:diguanylate cyclase [Methylonatrum kenyense]|uniref:GGDEF domain-containing protein n=1 Tax=Methylonatrum kenyense TaxID=455253 RepID=UPI0020BE2EE7|nr:GGDEF domain-containing protein [Methylonatrum kenyense]MCK8514778.1 diguanylate cyclase [Methylonatrum kenyense]
MARLKPAAAAGFVGFSYFLLAHLGVVYTVTPEGIAIVWLPNAMLLAVFLVSPKQYWPVFAGAALLAEIVADVPAFPLWAALAFGLINLSSVTLAAFLLRRFVDHQFSFHRFRHGLAFLLIGPLLAACLAGLFGALVYLGLGRADTSYLVLWRTWWFGDALGMLLLTPPLVVIARLGRATWGWPGWPALAETAAVLALILFITNHAFLPAAETTHGHFLTPVLVVPLLLWLAGRYGLIVTSIGVGLVTFQAIRFLRDGLHPFREASPTFVVWQLQEYLAAVAVAAVGLSLLVRELRRQQGQLEENEAALRAQRNVLEERVRARTRDLRRANRELHELNSRLANYATTDELTGVPNRRAFRERASRYLERAATSGSPVTLLMLDLDHFKKINDGHGHAAGDTVLRAIVQPMRDALRPGDVLARTGGEEFVVLLDDTSLSQGVGVAERIRAGIEEREVHHEEQVIRLSASFDVAQWNGAESLNELLDRADQAVYQAKNRGRNRVEHLHAEADEPTS